MVVTSLVLCMIAVLLSAAGTVVPQKALAKRTRH